MKHGLLSLALMILLLSPALAQEQGAAEALMPGGGEIPTESLSPDIPAPDVDVEKALKGLTPEEQQKAREALEGREEEPPPEEEEEEPQARRRPPERATGTAIERILSGRFPTEITRDLSLFGYDYFDREPSRFTPVGHIPVGDSYIIGPGDSFTIHLWGRTEATYNVSVNRDGRISLPRLGTLNVGGLRFSELKSYLRGKLQEFYPDFEMSVTMGELRTIDVFLVGEARRPGTYSVSSLATAITALFQAGGINKIGTLRDIRIMRQGKAASTLDLYDFFIRGSQEGDIRLRPGDTVFIPVLGPVVGIAGCVKRPAIYEMKGAQTLREMLDIAGGVLPVGHLQNVVVERVIGNERRVVRSFNLDPDASSKALDMPLQDGDVVKVYPVHDALYQVVYLEGHVKYPREYEYEPGMTVSDLIPSKEVLLPEPYLPQAEILRVSELISFDLGALLSGDESQDIELQDNDRVIVYGKWQKKDLPQVQVKGAVRDPGTYRLYDGMTIRELVFRAGNLTDRAYTKKATLRRVITRDEGPAETAKIDLALEKALSGHPDSNLTLHRDDVLYIRSIPEYADALNRTITLEGEFVFPGEYTFTRGERLSDVISRAGGLTPEGYPKGAVFQRQSVRRVQQERLEDYIDNLQEDILSLSAMGTETAVDKEEAALLRQNLAVKQQLLAKLRRTEPTGRMVVDLEEALAIPSSPDNFELRPGDRLIVEKRPDTINVMGEVYNPTALLLQPEKTVGHYLDLVGGMTKNAQEDEIYLVRADGTVISKSQKGFLGLATWDGDSHRWTMGGFDSIPVQPGDTIIVPRKVQKYPWLRVVKDVTQIVYQVALSAGVWLTHF